MAAQQSFSEAAYDRLLWLLAMIASIALSLVSFKTSYDGILAFLPNPWWAPILLIGGIQVMLFVSSWYLGPELVRILSRRRLRKYKTLTDDAGSGTWLTFFSIIFAICATISIFFSYESLYDTILPESQRKAQREAAARRTVERAVATVRDEFKSERDKVGAAIGSGTSFAAWRSGMDAIGDLAKRAPDTVRAAFEQQLKQAQDARAEQSRRVEDLAASIDAKKREAVQVEESLRILAAERQLKLQAFLVVEKAHSEKLAAVKAKEAEMVLEDGGTKASGKAGKGPVFEGLRRERDVLERERKRIESAYLDGQRSVDDVDDRIAKAKARLPELEKERTLLEEDLAQRNRIVAEQGQAFRAAAADTRKVNVTETVERLEQATKKFAGGWQAEDYRVASGLCQDLRTSLMTVQQLRPSAERVACELRTLVTEIGALTRLAEAEANVLAICGNEELAKPRGFSDWITFGSKCISTSNLVSPRINAARDNIINLEAERGEGVHRFAAKLRTAFDGDLLALLSLFIAIAIDFLVLLCALIGAGGSRAEQKQPIEDRLAELRDGAKATAPIIMSIVRPSTLAGYSGCIKANDIEAAVRARAARTREGLADLTGIVVATLGQLERVGLALKEHPGQAVVPSAAERSTAVGRLVDRFRRPSDQNKDQPINPLVRDFGVRAVARAGDTVGVYHLTNEAMTLLQKVMTSQRAQEPADSSQTSVTASIVPLQPVPPKSPPRQAAKDIEDAAWADAETTQRRP
jgi:hypothetical protein